MRDNTIGVGEKLSYDSIHRHSTSTADANLNAPMNERERPKISVNIVLTTQFECCLDKITDGTSNEEMRKI